LRRVTTRGRKLPANYKEILGKFIESCSLNTVNYTRSAIFNMDECAVELDSPSTLKIHLGHI
jgi:hypothetical protein